MEFSIGIYGSVLKRRKSSNDGKVWFTRVSNTIQNQDRTASYDLQLVVCCKRPLSIMSHRGSSSQITHILVGTKNYNVNLFEINDSIIFNTRNEFLWYFQSRESIKKIKLSNFSLFEKIKKSCCRVPTYFQSGLLTAKYKFLGSLEIWFTYWECTIRWSTCICDVIFNLLAFRAVTSYAFFF
jgi:hypothetical protein